MAKIKQIDLEKISISDLKDFMQFEDIQYMKNEYLRNLLKKSKDNYDLGNTINRIEKLIFQEITRRWLKGELIEKI